ncbi:MAG: S41 family peptidase, partial [Bacteroidota bacterium]
LPFITCDGVPREAELYQLEGQFWWFYAMRFGFKSTFRIEYKKADDRFAPSSKTLLVSAIRYNDRFDLLNEVYGFSQTELRPPIDFEVNNSVAVLTINQFYGIRKSKYIHFLDYCFAEIERLNIKSLIIDVRENGGGREGYENLLLSHLDNSLDQKYATVKMTSASSSYYKYMKHPVQNRIKDWVYKTFEFEDVDGDLVRRDRFKSTLDPQKNIFYGDVYVLIGGEVFSGGSDFASLAKSYARNCTLIGTETLGGAVANSSGYFYRVELPNTGMVIEVPRVLFELNVTDQKLGHGVLPDIEVTSPIESFVDSRDPAMEEAYQLILEKQELARLK